MPVTRVFVKKWSDGRIGELSISGRPMLLVRVTYDADGFPQALEIKGGKLLPLEIFGLLRFADRSMRGFGKGVTQGILKGEDNTEVSTLSTTYVLSKTITLYHVKTENPLIEIGWQLKTTNTLRTASGKITVETPTYSETTEDEQSTTSDSYVNYLKTFSREYSGTTVTIRVYLKISADTVSARNQNCKVYGKTTEEITYL